MANVNFQYISKAISKNATVRSQMNKIALEHIEKNKQILIENFNSHSVSSQISSRSGFLFSFIGFQAGDDPVKKWSNFLQASIVLENKLTSKNYKDMILFTAKVRGITDQDLVSVAPMPWEGGRSWIRGIERGISGYSFYLSKLGQGRSDGGIQSDFKVRSGQYQPVPYWSEMWNEFIRNISKGK